MKDKEYKFPLDIMIYDIETTGQWPFQDYSYISEFACVILDATTLEVKDALHTYVKVPEDVYENASEEIKKLHKDRWDIYLGKVDPPKNRVIIKQKQLVPLLKAKFGDKFATSQYKMIAWNESFDFSWLMYYFFKYGEGDLFSKMTYKRADLKSYFEAAFILNGNEGLNINSSKAYSMFEIGDVSHDALEDCLNEAKIFKGFCNLLR